MAGIQGMPTPTPQDIQSPVPQVAADPLAEFAIPGSLGPQREPAQVAPTTADPLQQYSVDQIGPAEAAPTNQEVQADQMSPMPAPEGWQSLKEQLGEAGARLRNAWTVTDPESLQVLKDSKLFDRPW